jgi:hypothetical protein
MYEMRDDIWIPRSERPSVVDNAVRVFAPYSVIHAHVICGTQWLEYPVDHPVYGKSNQQLHELLWKEHGGKGLLITDKVTGRIYLQNVLLAQLQSCGIGIDRIRQDGLNTLADRNGPGGDPLWWSNARGDRGRNGVIIVRR